MWCHLPAIFSRRRTLPFSAVLLLSVAFITSLLFTLPVDAAPGINQQINFQGRLLNGQGAVVPDGNYNIEFKLYQDGDGCTSGGSSPCSGTLKWTESYLNNNSQGVLVKNGYFSVQLGSITAFGTSVDWNQDTLWLSMNVAGTNPSCASFGACSPDGEMLPMRRLAATPYALNAGALNGLTSGNFVQLAQGVQNDASNSTSSIFLNKTGTGGNFITLQDAGTDAFLVSRSGDIQFGSNANHTISIADAPSSTSGRDLTLSAGNAGAGGANGGNVVIDAGTGDTTNGSIAIGTANASSITIGKAAGDQTISIGEATSGTTDVTIGSSGTAAGGSTTLQAKDSVVIRTGGIDRVTLANSNAIYFGNGITAATPDNYTISGTGSTTTGVAGGALTLQGGNATVGNANGGDVTITGGAGVGSGARGLVVLTTPTFSTTTNDPNCYTSGANVAASCTIDQASVNNSSAIMVGFSTTGQIATLPNPTNATAGRVIYVTAANASLDFTLSVNGGGVGNLIAMRQNTTATMIWNGAAWTAAGASSSTTLQSAYDNTLQSAGGAELIVGKTSNTNGLTIRDSSVNPVDGPLVSIQSNSAANLFSVNSNVTEYASDAGAETGTGSSFPASTWAAINGNTTATRYATAGDYIATGQASVSAVSNGTALTGVKNTLSTTLTANNHYNVSFSTRLLSGTFTDMDVYYSVDGTAASVECKDAIAVKISIWTKVNCSFTAPSSGMNASNAILIRQTGASSARTFYVDNLSVTIAADFSLATDGSVDSALGSNWTANGSASVSRSTLYGNDASSSVQVDATGANGGVKNLLAIAPQVASSPTTGVLYRVTTYVGTAVSGFNTFKIQYSPNNGTNKIDCVDYNTQTITQSTSTFTKLTCYIKTDETAVSTPYVYFTQTDGTTRTWYVDTFAMTLATATTPNVQVGGGSNGGPTTLFTLDKGASAPIAGDNESLLGSMYYDTTLGKLQCYEADGWGACGSSPDNIITISPEYTNAVMHGTGVGTMTSDICSNTGELSINTSICSTNETFNFYRWSSPQASSQTYSIYVTYQLPSTFKTFASGQTYVMGRTDSGDSTVAYTLYKDTGSAGSGLTVCGSAVTVSTGAQTSWQPGTATGAADPSTCGFAPNDKIVFKIDVSSSENANAYVGNLGFTFNNN